MNLIFIWCSLFPLKEQKLLECQMSLKELMQMKILFQEPAACGLMWGTIFAWNYNQKEALRHTDKCIVWNIIMIFCTTDL